MNGKRVLIVLHGAIGDVTRGLTLAVRMKRAWPGCRISWAVEPPSKDLVLGHPAVDRVVIFNRPQGFPAYRAFIRELREEPYDIVLDLQRHFKSGLTSFLSRGKQRIGFHRRNAKEFNWLWNNRKIEAVENFSPKILQYQKFGDALGLPEMSPIEFGLDAGPERQSRIDELLRNECESRGIASNKPLVGLIVGSSWKSRFWFPERYRQLIEELGQKRGWVSVLIGGKGELEFCEEILAERPDLPVINLCGKSTLGELPALFARMELVVGSDSGPMHIAAACGKKVISLWGSTSPKRSAPWGSESLVLQSAVGCSPCYRKECPGLNRVCMSDIAAEAVIARIDEAKLGSL